MDLKLKLSKIWYWFTCNDGDIFVFVPFNKQINGVFESLGVQKQRGNILEFYPCKTRLATTHTFLQNSTTQAEPINTQITHNNNNYPLPRWQIKDPNEKNKTKGTKKKNASFKYQLMEAAKNHSP